MKTNIPGFVTIALLFVNAIDATAQWTESGTNLFPVNYNTVNVGIGTNAPAEKLHINGSIRGNAGGGAIRINTTSGYVDIGPMNTSWSHFQTSLPKFYFNKPVHIDGALSSYNTQNLELQTNGTPRMTILNSNGHVGIGTTSPVGKVDINHAGAQLRLSGGTVAGGVWTSATDILYLADWNTGTKGLNVNMTTGNIGVGGSPSAKLEVVGPSTGSGPTIKAGGGGDVVMNSGGALFFDGNYSYASGNYIRPLTANTQAFFTSGAERLRITSSGNVGIGTTSPNQKLTVNGTIYGKEIKVDLNVPGPDYVFEKDYNLPSLEEIKTYIDQHKHLPEVPSAKEMEANGINLGEMNMILLKKMEEMTLHLIELKKDNDEIRRENEEIKKLLVNKK